MREVESTLVSHMSFSGKFVEVSLVNNVNDFFIEEGSFLLNPGGDYVSVREDMGNGVPPLSSTYLKRVHISSSGPVILFKNNTSGDFSEICGERGWHRFNDPACAGVGGARNLWKSSQDEVAALSFSRRSALPDPTKALLSSLGPLNLKLNLWFASAGTHCAIHNQHDFMEIHTQVLGVGHMQKFHENFYDSLYEDILMMPGFTTSQPFCVGSENGGLHYPWHQYYAQSDCVWMAIEYHRAN